jgi:hypothetical protein
MRHALRRALLFQRAGVSLLGRRREMTSTSAMVPVENFCRDCASAVNGRRPTAIPEYVWRFWAFFFGGLGAHKFYRGQTGLFSFWSFVPGIVGFIEGVVYLSMTDAAFNDRYNTQ